MILFICNTPFQLFNAIRIKYELFSDENADIILSDHSKVNSFFNSLTNTKVFTNVYAVESLKLARAFYFFNDKKKNKYLLRPNLILKKIINLDFSKYDIIFTANIDGFINLVYRYVILQNNKTIFNYYEDGWSSYTINHTNFALSPYEKKFSEVLGEKILQKNINELWLYDTRLASFPELFNLKSIPKVRLDDAKFKELVNTVFYYNDDNEYSCQHIFLEEAFSEDGYKNNDMEIIKSINKIVGSDNFMVKRHPRLSANRYESTNIKINTNMQLPWEVLILNNNFKDKILYTISSNACLTPSLVFDIDVPVFFFKKTLKGAVSKMYKSKEFERFLKKFQELYGDDNFYEIESLVLLDNYFKKYFYNTQKKAYMENKNENNCVCTN